MAGRNRRGKGPVIADQLTQNSLPHHPRCPEEDRHGRSATPHVSCLSKSITLCSVSNLAEARRLSSPLQGASLAKTRASSMPSRVQDLHFQLLQTAIN